MRSLKIHFFYLRCLWLPVALSLPSRVWHSSVAAPNKRLLRSVTPFLCRHRLKEIQHFDPSPQEIIGRYDLCGRSISIYRIYRLYERISKYGRPDEYAVALFSRMVLHRSGA